VRIYFVYFYITRELGRLRKVSQKSFCSSLFCFKLKVSVSCHFQSQNCVFHTFHITTLEKNKQPNNPLLFLQQSLLTALLLDTFQFHSLNKYQLPPSEFYKDKSSLIFSSHLISSLPGCIYSSSQTKKIKLVNRGENRHKLFAICPS